jgi:hypothetical protein
MSGTVNLVTTSSFSSNAIPHDARGKKVFFGTGLASSKEESCGFGFELLNTILTALIVMKEVGADSILHEIGTVGYNVSEEQQKRLVEEQLNIIINMTQNLGIEDVYDVELSHSYHELEDFRCAFQLVKEKLNSFMVLPNFQRYGNYTMIQIAQMKFLYKNENAAIKVGWIVGNKPMLAQIGSTEVEQLINKGNLNEYYFDSLYRYVFPSDEFSFIYTNAGMDILDGRRYAPYTVTKSQHRPLLIDPIKKYLSGIPESKYKREVLRFYEKSIVKNWENYFGEIDCYDFMSAGEKLITKLQYIQDKVLGLNVA